jgi:aminoglycoside phosphotransferase (APT) family kinase protein
VEAQENVNTATESAAIENGMSTEYLGILPPSDPLYTCLVDNLSHNGNGKAHPPFYRVYRLNASNEVYLYEDIVSGYRIVGKFFGPPAGPFHHAPQEFHNMCLLRGFGFTSYPHYIARPIAYNTWLNDLLLQEYCHGYSLGSIIEDALARGNFDSLYHALSALAYFLATLHNRTATDARVDVWKDYRYLEDLLGSLHGKSLLSYDEAREIAWYGEQWSSNYPLWQDIQVLVHGDATPGNFLFSDGFMVTAIDLERVQYRDRIYDVGRIAGELKHYFMRAYGDGGQAEAFIHSFLRDYSAHFPDRVSAFDSITKRLPFYMGLTLLRIARNSWLERGYRMRLIEEARNMLRP